jgi:uncharacterized protein (TIGR02246 family)
MTPELSPADSAALTRIVAGIERAWNAGDAAGFAAAFAADGDQVNIFGAHLPTPEQVEGQHAHIFATIYRESRSRFRIDDARAIGPDVALAHVRATVEVPGGPMEGTVETLGTMIFRRTSAGWEIATFHNTRVA